MKNKLILICFWAALMVTLSAAIFVFYSLVYFGASHVTMEFISTPSKKAGASGGILYQIFGSLLLIATALPVALIVAIPLSIWRIQHVIKTRAARLFDSLLTASHAVPSIAWGLFGFLFFVRGFHMGKSWLGGGITLGLLCAPFLIESALARVRAVPDEMLLSAHALGIDNETLIKKILLPFVLLGCLSGLKVNIPRCLGETAPILFTACVFSGVTLPNGIANSPILSLPYHILVLSQDIFSTAALGNAWATGLVLLFMSGTLNGVISWVSLTFERRLVP